MLLDGTWLEIIVSCLSVAAGGIVLSEVLAWSGAYGGGWRRMTMGAAALFVGASVITSYSIHYTKLYEPRKSGRLRRGLSGISPLSVRVLYRPCPPGLGGASAPKIRTASPRPLGRLSAVRPILRLIELERLVQHAHGQLEVLFLDHDRNLDLRGRDPLDVDAFLGERPEHARRDTGVRTHALV